MPEATYNAPDRTLRRKAIREILRREGRDMPTDEIHRNLETWFERTYSSRTTRNDLAALAAKPQIVKEIEGGGEDGRARYWKLNRAGIDLILSPTESMTLYAIFQHAQRFGLRAETEALTTLRDYVADSIRAEAERDLLAEGRIRSGTRFTVLEPGNYQPEHLETIQDALRRDLSLEVTYRPREAGGVECIYLLKPLALSHQDSNIYLSAYVAQEEWPSGSEPEPGALRGKYSSNGPGSLCALMLHRMVRVKTTVLTIAEPADYDPDSLAAQRDLMTIHSDEPIELHLRLSANLCNRLSENPLTADQVLSEDGHSGVLKCRLQDTQGLRLFLLGNAADIEVLAPQPLREHVSGSLRQALARYERKAP